MGLRNWIGSQVCIVALTEYVFESLLSKVGIISSLTSFSRWVMCPLSFGIVGGVMVFAEGIGCLFSLLLQLLGMLVFLIIWSILLLRLFGPFFFFVQPL